ncbi:MAG TPA: hypothetical protein PKD53_24680 [Chloroflexaceae bacterium]|nr:hypothetical protein [Chloroflexaceae bacterium]
MSESPPRDAASWARKALGVAGQSVQFEKQRLLFWPSLLLLLISFPRRVWPTSLAPRTVAALIYLIPVAAGLFTLTMRNSSLYLMILVAQLGLIVVTFVVVPTSSRSR